ncbi:DUF6531 domain-containing protein [Streptomyces sp. A5-4]|uniref:DUF6531 domain-containing protein n=1 Tax=Streptomyces sp. A5-4 TaxID=3384771 RepID=UPI003DA99D81
MAANRPGDWHVLDLEKDPTPGDPQRVKALSRELQDFADDVSDALRLVKGMASEEAVLKWAGKSAKAFQDEFEDVPKHLKKLEKSYGMAGDALATYWPKLERAQALADKALVNGREAQADLKSATSRLTDADSWVGRATKESDDFQKDKEKKDAPAPDEDKVRAATRNAQSAKSAQGSAKSDVSSANSALDAAKKMAADARKMREDAAREAKGKLDEASDAGIQNRKWWEEVGDWVTDNWDTIVAVCKVVVAVLGIVAMIIGGPIALIVLAAALIVLADTLNKYAKGEASLWDVAFAALDCIPGMKGLTTLGGLAKGLKGGLAVARGGMKAMGKSVLGLAKSARGAIADGAKGTYNRLKTKIKGCGDPVDAATGQMFLAQTDATLPGTLPLSFTRRASSGYRTGFWFGPSWSSTIDQHLEIDEHGVIFVTEDGMLLAYPHPESPDARVLPESGPRWILSRLDHGGYLIDDPLTGHSRRFAPPANGLALLERISDRNHNTIDFDYDSEGTPLGIRHSGGYHLKITVDDGRLTRLDLAGGSGNGSDVTIKQYGYTDGNLTAITNSSGLPLQLTYDEDQHITSWLDTNHSRYDYSYDDQDRCIAQGGEAGHVANTFTYDNTHPAWPDCHITEVTTAAGATSRYVVNDVCLVIAEIDPVGDTVITEYDAHQHVVASTDQLGHTTRLENSDLGMPLKVVRPDGGTTRFTYNDLNLATTVELPDGTSWQYAYDEVGNCTALTDPNGETTRYTIGARGEVQAVIDPLGERVEAICDDAGLPVAVTVASGAVSHHEYDAFGRVVATARPGGGMTRLTWSVEGQLLSQTGPDGATEAWAFDGEGNCVLHTDPLGGTLRSEYGHFDLLTAQTGPDGTRHTFAYDAELRLTAVTNPQGLTWAYRYDLTGQLVEETDFDGHSKTYEYDANGRVTRNINSAGQIITYRYDSIGQMVEKTIDGRVAAFENDLCGRLLRATSPDSSLEFQYDATGRVIAQLVDGRTLATSCDASGRRTRRTTPVGVTTAYSYDSVGNYEALTVAGRVFSLRHDAAGREIQRSLGDRFTLAFAWDGQGHVAGQTLTVAGRTRPQIHRTFTHREDGHLTAISDQDTGRRTFTLDRAGRVTTVDAANWTEAYAYDDAGNQTHASWPDRNRDRHPGDQSQGPRTYRGTRLTSAGNTHFEYDAAGRAVLRRKRRLSRKPDIWRYTWDAEYRLTSVTTPDGTQWRYVYDPLGRRIAKQRLGTDGSVAEETRFVWDGSTLAEQTTQVAESPELITLTWDHDGLAPLSQTETKSLAQAPQQVIDQRFFAIVTDQIGTPTELVDEDGTIAWRSRSTLWGATEWNGDATAYTPLRFPGQYYDPETGLHHNYFRHYDPETGRYLTLDPLGIDPAPNPATYVDNPHTQADPLGLSPCDEADITWGGRVQYGAPGPGGRATGMTARIESDMTGGVTSPPKMIPGYQKYKQLNKTHLLGAQIGGSNKSLRNFVTMHRNANNPVMKHVEDQIRKAVDRTGETIDYKVTPIYRTNDPSDVVPVALTLEARGDKGFSFTPYEGGESVNSLTILNVPKPI